jgi:hypothetical protein
VGIGEQADGQSGTASWALDQLEQASCDGVGLLELLLVTAQI